MSPEAIPDVRRLFEEALEIEPERRAGWLAEHAGEVRIEVEKLLQAHESGTHFLNRVGAALSATAAASLTGQLVGPYELGDALGHGGMGAVYRASRADDAFHKFVAIKLLGFQYAGPEMELAFRMERQILASLEHPNIAGLIDGGATPEGLLFIVMDTVRADHLSLYGYGRDTSPNLRRLAQDSVVYTHAQAPADMTLPSHASMFTGLYASWHGAFCQPPEAAHGRALNLDAIPLLIAPEEWRHPARSD